ncbi:MAG: hypothetical protein ACOC3V_02695 [bacterium]
MFKKGDIVVCINNINVSSDDEVRESKYLELNKSYVVENPNGGGNDVKVEGIDFYYKWKRFVPIEKHRISKLNKIRNIYDKKTIRYCL